MPLFLICSTYWWLMLLPSSSRRWQFENISVQKPTHTDVYLQWDSHHNIPSKYSVAGTLFHRATTICSDPTLLQEEEQHLFKALKKCKYPTWAINRAKLKSQNPNRNKEKQTIKRAQETTKNHLLGYYLCLYTY